MKILITGSEGNVGSVLMPYLRSVGHEVYGVDIKQRYYDNFCTLDVNNAADLAMAFLYFEPQVCIHLAAMVSRVTSEKAPAITVQTNVAGTMNIIQLCKAHGTKLLYFSTSEVYGNVGGLLYESDTPAPNNLYGLTKRLGEQLVQYEVSNGLDALVVRPFMFYHENETGGSHRSAMIRFVSDLIAFQPVVAHADSVRTWLHLDDGVVIIEKLCHVKGFCFVNVGHPTPVRTEDLARLICTKLEIDPANYVRISPLPARMTLTKYPSLDQQQTLTGYTPQIGIEEGVERVIKQVRFNY